jgi:hypothetical protein
MARTTAQSEVINHLEGLKIPGETPVPGRQPRALVRRRDGSELVFFYRAGATSAIDLVHVVSGELPEHLATVLRLSPASTPPIFGSADVPAAMVRQAAVASFEDREVLAVLPAPESIGHHDLVLEGMPIPPIPTEPTWEYQVIS